MYYLSTSWNALERDFSDRTPACEIQELNDQFLVTLEMPGVPKDALKVEILDTQLTVSGERKLDRNPRIFQRSFTLPVGVQTEKIEADYQDGVLRLMIPKPESAKPRQIKIGASHSGLFSRLLEKSSPESIRQPDRGLP